MSSDSKFTGSWNTPILKVLFTFSESAVENSKFPCVSPPPCTVWRPTILSKGVLAPDAAVFGMNFLAIIIVQ